MIIVDFSPLAFITQLAPFGQIPLTRFLLVLVGDSSARDLSGVFNVHLWDINALHQSFYF
jgi:hypothetical protein